MNKKILLVLSVVLSLSLLLAACDPAATAEPAADESAAAETAAMETKEEEGTNIMLYDYAGDPVDIFADGKPVYLKAWASWCPSCLAGLGELDALMAEEHDYKVVSIVSPGTLGEKSEDEFKHWLAGLSSDYPNVDVLFDRDADMMYSLNIQAFPTSFYFDAEGNLVDTRVGHNDNEYINQAMAALQ